MRISYNRNASIMLDADLALLSDTEFTGFTGLRLCWNAKLTGSCWSWNTMLLKITLTLKRVATQARVLALKIRSYLDSHLSWNTKLLRLAFWWSTRLPRLMLNATFASPAWWSPTFGWNTTLVSILKSAFKLKCDPRSPMRPAFAIVSLVIFRQPTEPPLKFTKFHGWLGRIYIILIWAFVIEWTIIWSIQNLILSGFWSLWVYCWTTWIPREDHRKYLELSLELIWALICLIGVLLNW